MPKKRRWTQRLRAWAEKDGRGYPDWAMRYHPVVRALRPWFSRSGVVLELGANENGLARFIDRPVVVVDISHESLAAARRAQRVLPVRADISALPFADGSITACVCMDTFEHVNAELRDVAAAEITRALRPDAAAVIGFPAGTGAFEAEARVRAAYYRYTGRTIKWLEEHVDHGLPTGVRMYAALRECAGTGRRVTRTWNANLWVWEWMWLVLMCGWPGRGNAVFQALLRVMTPLLTHCNFGPCYRTMLWVFPREKQP